MHQFRFISRRHDDEIRQVSEVGDVEGSGMRRAIRTDQTGAVDGESDGQALQGDVVDDLVIATLQEGRVDRAERLHARACQAR